MPESSAQGQLQAIRLEGGSSDGKLRKSNLDLYACKIVDNDDKEWLGVSCREFSRTSVSAEGSQRSCPFFTILWDGQTALTCTFTRPRRLYQRWAPLAHSPSEMTVVPLDLSREWEAWSQTALKYFGEKVIQERPTYKKQSVEPLEDHVERLRLQFKTLDAARLDYLIGKISHGTYTIRSSPDEPAWWDAAGTESQQDPTSDSITGKRVDPIGLSVAKGVTWDHKPAVHVSDGRDLTLIYVPDCTAYTAEPDPTQKSRLRVRKWVVNGSDPLQMVQTGVAFDGHEERSARAALKDFRLRVWQGGLTYKGEAVSRIEDYADELESLSEVEEANKLQSLLSQNAQGKYSLPGADDATVWWRLLASVLSSSVD